MTKMNFEHGFCISEEDKIINFHFMQFFDLNTLNLSHVKCKYFVTFYFDFRVILMEYYEY